MPKMPPLAAPRREISVPAATRRFSRVQQRKASHDEKRTPDPSRLLASGAVKRSDFGIDFGIIAGAEKLMLGDKIKIELDLQFIAP